MSLRQRFQDDMKEALRAKDQVRLATVRLIIAAMKERDIASRTDGRNDGVGDDELLQMLQKMIKQRAESIATYRGAGREDLATQEEAEKAIIESYLPQQMGEDEVRAAVAAIVAETGAASVKDMGKVMGLLKGRFAGRMDFGKANGVVKDALAAKG